MQPVMTGMGFELGMFPVAERAAESVFSLPMGPDLKVVDQDRVVKALLE